MYLAFAAVSIPVAVSAVTLGIMEFDQQRMTTIAQHEAGLVAIRLQQLVKTSINQCLKLHPTAPQTCRVQFATPQRGQDSRPWACIGHYDYPNDPPTIFPEFYPTISGPEAINIVVTQTMRCPGTLLGTVTATQTVTVPIPPVE